MCSTPFGIRGRITGALRYRRAAYRVLNAFRHQRKDHEITTPTGSTNSKGSTPFGIRGRITRYHDDPGVDEILCSTPFGIRGRITSVKRMATAASSRAQRLSASEEGSPTLLNVNETVLNRCAQRLSASEEGSLAEAEAQTQRNDSLCSTPFGIRGRITEARDTATGAEKVRCSTPFGIRGRITGSAGDSWYGSLRVLNAFRHQRKDHR